MSHTFSRILRRASFWVALAVMIGLLGGPLAGDAPAQAKKKPLRFGVADPLTGPAAIFGKDQMQAVRWAVEDINAKRRAKYQGIAESKSTDLAAVEAVAGEKLIDRAGPGEMVMDASGQWLRK